jgi:hypothetical protein
MGVVLVSGCEPYDPDGRLVSPDAYVATEPPGYSAPEGAQATNYPVVTITHEPASPTPPVSTSPEPPTTKSPPASPPPAEKPKESKESEDDTPELFDCIRPKQCSSNLEERAKTRARKTWKCETEITSEDRPTKGLSVNGSTLVINGDGTAELHVKPGVTGGKAFTLSGCGHTGIIACIPAHRTVKTADVTYDKVDDRVCLWAQE